MDNHPSLSIKLGPGRPPTREKGARSAAPMGAFSKLNVAEEAIVAFVQTLGKLAAQEGLRLMVRDAGCIAPLVALLISGTGNVPGLAASVLRDLALHSGMATAILEADGVAQLVRMLSNDSRQIASEAADALRSLCKENPRVCAVVRESKGVKLLVQLVKGGLGSEAATQATGALTNLAEVDSSSLEEIAEAGGVGAVVGLLTQGLDQQPEVGGGGRQQRGGGSAANAWAQSRAAADVSAALQTLAAHKSCLRRMLDAAIVPDLVRALHVHVHMHAHMNTHAHTCTHAFTHAHAHMHIHTHMHMRTCLRGHTPCYGAARHHREHMQTCVGEADAASLAPTSTLTLTRIQV